MALRTALLVTVALFMCYACIRGKALKSFAGPWFATTRRFESCASSGTYRMELKGSHYNPAKPFVKQTISGFIDMKEDWTDAEWALVRMSIRSNNQWKQNAFIFKFVRGACSALRAQLPDFFNLAARISNASMLTQKNAPCMVPKGNWTLLNEPVSWTFPKVPTMPYGRYLFGLTFGRAGNDTPGFCNNVECDILPIPQA